MMLVSSCDGETEQSDLGVLPPEHRHLRVSPHPAAPGPPQLPRAREGEEPGGWDEQVEHPAAGGAGAAAGVDQPRAPPPHHHHPPLLHLAERVLLPGRGVRGQSASHVHLRTLPRLRCQNYQVYKFSLVSESTTSQAYCLILYLPMCILWRLSIGHNICDFSYIF